MTKQDFTNDFAKKVLQAMDLREKSWNGKSYQLTERDAVCEVFGDDPMGQVAWLIIYLGWNDAEEWARNPEKCQTVVFRDKRS